MDESGEMLSGYQIRQIDLDKQEIFLGTWMLSNELGKRESLTDRISTGSKYHYLHLQVMYQHPI